MKKLTLILGLIFAFMVATNAQKAYKEFTNDTVMGNENIYFTYGASNINAWSYLAGFSFTPTQIAGTTDGVYLQGTLDGTNYVTIDQQLTPTSGTTYFLYDYTSNTSTLTSTTITEVIGSMTASVIDTCGLNADTTTIATADTSTSTTTTTFTNVYKTPMSFYKKYRLWVDGGAGDTVIFDVTFILKEED